MGELALARRGGGGKFSEEAITPTIINYETLNVTLSKSPEKLIVLVELKNGVWTDQRWLIWLKADLKTLEHSYVSGSNGDNTFNTISNSLSITITGNTVAFKRTVLNVAFPSPGANVSYKAILIG